MSCDGATKAEKHVLPGPLKLPQELFDMIIDYLHNDSEALKTCSLVCKSWVSSASSLLFATLACPPCPELWNRTKWPDSQDSGKLCLTGESGFDHCLAMLTGSRRVASAVSCLRLSSTGPHRLSLNSCLRYSTIMQMLNSLPRVRVVDFVDCIFEEDASPSALRRTCGDLEVRFTTSPLPWLPLDRPWNEVQLIPALSPIQKLVISDNLLEKSLQHAQALPVHTAPARVDAFEADWITDGRAASHFHCLGRYVEFASLRVLTLYGPLCNRFTTFLDPVPRALEELTYHVTAGASPALGACTRLRAVILVGELSLVRGGASQWLDIVRDLRALPAPAEVHDVGIVLRLHEDTHWREQGCVTPVDVPFERLRRSLADQDWARLAACLTRFTALQTLRFQIKLYAVSPQHSKLNVDGPRCIRIMREVVADSLPRAVVAMTTVDAVAKKQSLYDTVFTC